MIGLSEKTIGDIESGRHGTAIDNLIVIANALETSLDYIILGIKKERYEHIFNEIPDEKKKKSI